MAGALRPAGGVLRITVDAQSVIEPFRHSMIGLRNTSQVPGLAESIDEMTLIGPAVVSIGVDLDGPISSTAPFSPAVLWGAGYQSAGSVPTAWLTEFESRLYERNIVPLIQTDGAPPQYAATRAVRPAIHPAPTDLQGYTGWTQSWLSGSLHVPSAMVLTVNEPGHTFSDFLITKDAMGNVILPDETPAQYTLRRRLGRDLAARQNADMLVGAAVAQTEHNRLGVGAFIRADHLTVNGTGMSDGVRTFYDGAMDEVAARTYPKPLSFIAYNSFYGGYADIFQKWLTRNSSSMRLPAVFSQYAPRRVQEALDDPTGPAGSLTETGAACDMLTDMEQLLHRACEAVCRAYWIGPKYSLVKRSVGFTRLAGWYALSFWTSLPPRRVALTGATPTAPDRASLGVHAVAGIGPGMLRVMLWNDGNAAQSVTIDRVNLPSSLLAASSVIQRMTQADASPQDLGPWTGSLELPAESFALVSWRDASSYDASTLRRASLGTQCRLLSAPMDCAPAVGGWGKWDGVRGLAQLYYQGNLTLRARATFAGLPSALYLTPFVDGQTGGRLRLWASFEGSASSVLVFNQAVSLANAGQVAAVDLAAFAGAAWWNGARQATLELVLMGAQAGAMVNVWFSADPLEAARLGRI